MPSSSWSRAELVTSLSPSPAAALLPSLPPIFAGSLIPTTARSEVFADRGRPITPRRCRSYGPVVHQPAAREFDGQRADGDLADRHREKRDWPARRRSKQNPETDPPLATVGRTATQPVGVAGVCSVIGWPALEAWSLIEETVLSSP